MQTYITYNIWLNLPTNENVSWGHQIEKDKNQMVQTSMPYGLMCEIKMTFFFRFPFNCEIITVDNAQMLRLFPSEKQIKSVLKWNLYCDKKFRKENCVFSVCKHIYSDMNAVNNCSTDWIHLFDSLSHAIF